MGSVIINSGLEKYTEMISHYYTYLLYFFSFDPGDITFSVSPPSDIVMPEHSKVEKELLYRMTRLFVRRLMGQACPWIETSVAEYLTYDQGWFKMYCSVNSENDMIKLLKKGIVC